MVRLRLQPYMHPASMPSKGVPFLGQYTMNGRSQRLSPIISAFSNQALLLNPSDGLLPGLTCGTGASDTIS